MSQEETPNQQRRQNPAQPTPATPVDLPRPAPLTLWTPEDEQIQAAGVPQNCQTLPASEGR